MDKIQLQDFDSELPDSMPVAVVMEKKPSAHRWIDFSYNAVGVVSSNDAVDEEVRKILEHDGIERYLIGGLQLRLHVDECESYYHNLMAPHPGCFIVASTPEDPNEMPIPYLVSLSFDEVHAYLEGDETVYAVEIPPELYKWTESYVLQYYVATRKKKRKLTDWRQQSGDRIILHHDSKMT